MFEGRIGFVATLGFAGMPPARVAKTLAELGYAAVEYTPRHFNPRTMSPDELKSVVDATASEGLKVSDVVVLQDYVCLDEGQRADRVAFSIEMIQACAEVGVHTVNVFTGPAPWVATAPRVGRDISEGAAWQMVIDAFDAILPELAKRNVHAAVENVWGHLCHDYYTARVLIDRFNSPWLGVNFDPSHDVLYGNTDTGWLVHQWGQQRIKHIHLKDAAGVPVQGQYIFPLLGEGFVDWKGMFTALADIGYGGFLSVEFESFAYYARILKGDTREAARRSMENLRILMAEAAK
jgi:sugar phosphate isomerase/epimerase